MEKVKAHINSLNGQMAEVTIIARVDYNDYIVEYHGIRCHAIFNPFVCAYYADDVYGVIEDKQ